MAAAAIVVALCLSSAAGRAAATPEPPSEERASELLDAAGYEAAMGEPFTGPEDLGTFPFGPGVVSVARVLSESGLLYTIELYTLPTIDDARAQFFAVQGARIPSGAEVTAGEFAMYADGTVVVHKSGQVLVVSVDFTEQVLAMLQEQEDLGNDTTALTAAMNASVVTMASRVADAMTGQTSTSSGLLLPDGGVDPCTGLPASADEAFELTGAVAVNVPSQRPPALQCRVVLAEDIAFDVFTLTDEQVAASLFADDTVRQLFELQRAAALPVGGEVVPDLGAEAFQVDGPAITLATLQGDGSGAGDAMITYVVPAQVSASVDPGDFLTRFATMTRTLIDALPQFAPTTTTTAPTTSTTTPTTTSSTTTTSVVASTTSSSSSTTTSSSVAATTPSTVDSAVAGGGDAAPVAPAPVGQPDAGDDDDGEDGSVGTVVAVGLPLVAIAAGGVVLTRRRRGKSRPADAPEVRATAGTGTQTARTTGGAGTSLGVRGVAGPATYTADEKKDGPA